MGSAQLRRDRREPVSTRLALVGGHAPAAAGGGRGLCVLYWGLSRYLLLSLVDAGGRAYDGAERDRAATKATRSGRRHRAAALRACYRPRANPRLGVLAQDAGVRPSGGRLARDRAT